MSPAVSIAIALAVAIVVFLLVKRRRGEIESVPLDDVAPATDAAIDETSGIVTMPAFSEVSEEPDRIPVVSVRDAADAGPSTLPGTSPGWTTDATELPADIGTPPLPGASTAADPLDLPGLSSPAGALGPMASLEDPGSRPGAGPLSGATLIPPLSPEGQALLGRSAEVDEGLPALPDLPPLPDLSTGPAMDVATGDASPTADDLPPLPDLPPLTEPQAEPASVTGFPAGPEFGETELPPLPGLPAADGLPAVPPQFPDAPAAAPQAPHRQGQGRPVATPAGRPPQRPGTPSPRPTQRPPAPSGGPRPGRSAAPGRPATPGGPGQRPPAPRPGTPQARGPRPGPPPPGHPQRPPAGRPPSPSGAPRPGMPGQPPRPPAPTGGPRPGAPVPARPAGPPRQAPPAGGRPAPPARPATPAPASSGEPVKDVMAEVSATLGLLDRIDQTGIIGDIRFPTAVWHRHRASMPMLLPPDQVMSVTMFYQTLASINQILDRNHSGLAADQPLSDGVRAQLQFIRQIGEQMALGALTGGGPK